MEVFYIMTSQLRERYPSLRCTFCFGRAVCRKHELTQFELEMASQDLISKKQQREELATGVRSTPTLLFLSCFVTSTAAPVTFSSLPRSDRADVLLERHDQQAIWPRGPRAEGSQTEVAGGADSRGRRGGQGENGRVRVSPESCSTYADLKLPSSTCRCFI